MDGAAVTVFAGRHSRAFCYNPGAEVLQVRFGHRRDDAAGFEAVPASQAVLRLGYGHLIVQTAQNDYYVNDDLAALRQALYGFCVRYATVNGIGYSMGGFGALLLSRALHLRQVVLVSPQRMGFPATQPFATQLADEMAAFYLGDDPALAGIVRGLKGVVLADPFGGRGRDMAYARMVVQMAPKLQLLAMPGAGHPATQMIKEAKLYPRFQRATLAKRIKIEDLRAVHRQSREASPRYQQFLQRYLRKRLDRGAAAPE